MCAVLLFLGCMACGPCLKFMVQGKTAEAQVLEVTEVETRSQQAKMHKVAFEFHEADGTCCYGCDAVRGDLGIPAGGTIEICYIPGSGDSARLARNVRSGLGIFLVAFGMLAYFTFVFGQKQP
jgi:hypothetical protein